jgi:hypothetical protein
MTCSRDIKGRSFVLVFVAVAALFLAACGSGSPRTVSVPAPDPLPSPSHESPQAAVAGYMTGYVQNNGEMVCEYVAPSQRSLCKHFVSSATYSVSEWSLGNSVVRGNEAIVAILADKWCAGPACIHNTDANKGLPQDGHGFERAFDSTANAVPVVSVVDISDKWYVALA